MIQIIDPLHGIITIKVCASNYETDEDILSHCNAVEKPGGNKNGWIHVIRFDDKRGPCSCDLNLKTRTHFLVEC